MKKCSECNELKDESLFGKDSKSKDKLNSWCKSCKKKYTSKWYSKHPEYNQQYYSDNAESICRDNKVRYNKNRQNRLKINKEYYEIHKEECKDRSKQYQKNRIKIDPLFRLKKRIRTRICNDIKRNGYTKKSHTHDLLDCSYEDLLKHLGPEPIKDASIDHVCPLAQAKTEEEILKLQHWSNLKWMVLDDNNSKNDNWTPEGEELCRKLLGREWIYE